MTKSFTLAFLLCGFLCCTEVFAQDQGETLFNQSCVACHTIGGGRLVGPDLAQVHTRREEAWIVSFVQNSQELIAAGNADAVALFDEYNQFPMPPHALSDDEVLAIVGYIARRSPADETLDPETPVELPVDLTALNVEHGRDLFVGRVRFENGGAACNACHHVDTDAVMTGGALAKDLTTAFSRLTGSGIEAMMSNPPFPAMREAFEGRELTEEEKSALVAFLQAADEEHETQQARDYGNTLLTSGLIGIVFVLGFFALLGIRGTKRTVNQQIYERQLKST